ncbi:MAG: 6-bladed beta-propeller [Bacteroidaceae bacterium]|nr:6-bladed beta-propeller [Bacteroidaceae bacterium]
MRKYPKFLFVLPVLAVMAGCNFGSNLDGVEVITANDIYENADLTEIAYDFRVHPLKCDGPLDGIGGIKSWGDIMLARSSDSRKILRFDNYKLTSVLDRLGRGPGEYYFIEDFSYDSVNNAIYIENDSNLVTYDANTLEFKGKQPVNIMIQNILNLGDKMLYFGYFLDEYNMGMNGIKMSIPFESMILVDRDERDLRKGTVLYRESSLQRTFLGYPELFYVNPKNRSTCLTGFVNRIVTFDDKEVKDVYRFKLGDGDVPQRAQAIFEKDELNIVELESAYRAITEAVSASPMISNTFNIMVDGNTVSFRTNYNADASFGPYSRYLYWVHNDEGTMVYKHLRIPGLAKDIDPTGCNGNHQIAIIENLGDDAIDESVPMSPLAQQIIDELKKQNDDNPVLIEFRFK